MRIAVAGGGYVGLVAAACFADSGHQVAGLDIDPDKVARLARGECPIYEPGLTELLGRNLRAERLSFTTDAAAAFADAAVAFACVGTPPVADGSADLSAVEAVADAFVASAPESAILVLKSTVPVGTNERLQARLDAKSSRRLEVASNPEFLKEGTALDDFQRPDRVVLGVRSRRAEHLLRDLYEPFVRSGAPVLVMDPASAELVKYAANAMLACRISLMNEIANVAGRVGADVDRVRVGVGTDRRLGRSFLFPGIGYGGSCFPKDVRALAAVARAHDVEPRLLDAIDAVNEEQKLALVPAIMAHFGGNLKGRRIALWGLAFKPRTDDVREAPAIAIAGALADLGARVAAYDPEATETAKALLGDGIDYAPDAPSALDGADALVVATEWPEFRRPDLDAMKKRLAAPVVFDGRNLYDPGDMTRAGFTYYSIGRPPAGAG